MAETSRYNTTVFPRKLLKKFILMYKENTCLWDKKSVMYKNKKKRYEAIKKLTELVQKYDPSVTIVHILKKIESLRSCVRREYKKVLENRINATSPEDLYTPNLWYYNLLSFAFDEEDFKMKCKSEMVQQESEEEIESGEIEEPITYSDYTISTNMVDDNSCHTSKQFTFEEEKTKRHCTEVEDEYDAIGINVAAKLRSLPANMRILAEKLINDVLFQAQTNGLNSATAISTPDPFK